MTTAAPRPSPRPNAPALGEDSEPITGVYPATRDFVREVNHSGLFRVAWWIGGAAVVLFMAGVMGARAVAQEAKDAGQEVAKAHESRLIALEQQVPQLRQEVYDTRLDVRDLYQAVRQGKRSERLETPPPKPMSPDGGTPP